jgi:hypothetical protein
MEIAMRKSPNNQVALDVFAARKTEIDANSPTTPSF